MRRAVWLLAGVLLAVTALGSDAPKEYDGATQEPGIEGVWSEVSYEVDGSKEPCAVPDVGMVFRRGEYRWTGPVVNSRGVYRIDTSHTPALVDRTETAEKGDGRTYKGIYRVEGDTLKLAWCRVGDQRPKGFYSDKQVIFATFKRVK
jgi:uncharacterized protein (TIGR03067 family)